MPLKVTVVILVIFQMVEHGIQSHFITEAFISGGLGNTFVFIMSNSLEDCLER